MTGVLIWVTFSLQKQHFSSLSRLPAHVSVKVKCERSIKAAHTTSQNVKPAVLFQEMGTLVSILHSNKIHIKVKLLSSQHDGETLYYIKIPNCATEGLQLDRDLK